MKAGLAVLWLVLGSLAASAQEMGALVTEASGGISPPVAPFDELSVGAELTLAPGAVLAAEHYTSCESVTIGGGTLGVGRDGFRLGGAAVLGLARLACPRIVRLAEDTVAAGVVIRSLGPDRSLLGTPTMGLEPSVVVAGGADSLRIDGAEGTLAVLPVTGGRVSMPAAGLGLRDGAVYRLIVSRDGAERQVEVLAVNQGPARVVLRPRFD